MIRLAVRVALLACACFALPPVIQAAPPRELTGKQWLDMDYGPYLTASIDAPFPRGNIAQKGLAIRLGEAFGGEKNEAVLFDTDLLRYAAGWSGGYVDLKGVVFDGEHWAYPRISGAQEFGTLAMPGWGRAGSFADPRERPYGPIPKDWAAWKGLYLHGNRVILSYAVGDAAVLEMPGLERGEGIVAFSRTIEVGRSARDLSLEVFYSDGGEASISPDGRTIQAKAGSLPIESAGPGGTTAAAFAGLGPGARWIADVGHARLFIPASATPTRFRTLVRSGDGASLPLLARLASSLGPPTPLEPLTRGGPGRWSEKVVTRGVLGGEAAPYAIDSLTGPDENPWRSWMRYGGFDFFRDASRAAISTWSGDVWTVSGIDAGLEKLTWQRIATGLYQPLGLKIVDDQVFVLGRDQITKLHDLDGDGETDFYECFNNDHQNTEHFHEFALDLQTDAKGDFYYMKAARHARDALVPQHGTMIRVARDGTSSEIIANGFRAPNGLLITPRGEFFSTDQQGFWLPANRINRLTPGSFHGNMWSFHRGPKPVSYDPPLCWLHPSVDRSPSTLAWVSSENWGPLGGSLLSLSYGMGEIFLVLRDSAGGFEQGAVTRLPVEFDTGIHRARFHPADGQLYVAGLYGWAGNKTRPGGFYRVRYTGKPLRMPASFHAAADGVLIGFTEPLDAESAADAGSYGVQCWNYRWTENYGSPDFKRDGKEGRDTLEVESVSVSADRKRVFLKLPGITPVMQAHLELRLKAADGAPIRAFVHGTIHALGAEPGAASLGAGATVARRLGSVAPGGELPGLLQSFRSLREAGAATADEREARLVALHVPSGSAPTPFIEAGPFECVWEGFLRSEIQEERSFDVRGRGAVSVQIAGKAVIAEEGDELGGDASVPVSLAQGLNPIRVTYRSSPSGDAELRLYWSGGGSPRGPVSPEMLAHGNGRAPAGAALRRGLDSFAVRRCARCHAPEIPPGDETSGLAMDAPSLEGIGSRLTEGWMAAWIEDPGSHRQSASMPNLLRGSPEERRRDAADLAAFLAAQKETSKGGSDAAAAPAPERAEEGARLWSALGCFACHTIAGQLRERGDDPVSLEGVASKWRPAALVRYLLEPQRTFRWTRMPDFHLSRDEAESLAAFLLGRSTARPVPPKLQGSEPRGSELAKSLGCAACHAVPGATGAAHAPRLEPRFAPRIESGCLAEDGKLRGKAPDHRLGAEERGALREFVATGLDGLRRPVASEIAERHIHDLRCGACHERDGRKDSWLELSPPVDVAEGRGGTDPAEAIKTIHRSRPPLTWAGEKLRPEWTERLLRGSLAYKPRPRLEARMPAFPAYAQAIARGLAGEHGFQPTTPEREPPPAPIAEIGKSLIQPGAFVCVQCHPVGATAALAGPDTETIDLRRVTDRLTRHFYDRFVEDPQPILPGTMMPRYSNDRGESVLREPFGGNAAKQLEAIWIYLRTIESSQ